MHILMTVNAAWNIWNFRRPMERDFDEAIVVAAYRDAIDHLTGQG